MSAWDDFEALLDKAEPPGPSRNPPMRALERGRAQLMTDEERAESDQYESSPEQRAAHRRAIADQRDPARRKILQQAYDQDTQNFTGNPLDFGPSTGEKAIDTTRPIIRNPDKSWSTERTITIEADGKHMLLPTIVDGKEYKPEDAVRLWREGKNNPVGTFGSVEEADRAARARSERIGAVRGAEAGEKSDAELGAEILSQYGNREPAESENLLDSIRSGLSKGLDLVTNVLRPRSAADRERQEGRIAEAGRGLNQTQRDVIERQRQTAMRSAAQPELRQDIARMRAANIEADRERKPRPYPEARIANLERQALPVNALNAAERSQMEQAQAARDVAMGDFWRNVEAGAKNLDPMYRKVMGGFLQAYGEALNAELDARGEALDENLTGEVSDARRTATTAADMGRTFIDQASIIERENMGDLRPGLGAQTVNSAVHSLAMMAPALAGGWLVRSPGAVIAIMSSETGAQAYGEGRKEGLSPGQAGVYALLQATIEGATEYAPVKALFADAPEGALKWFLNFLSKEVGQELLATGLQGAVDKVSVRPEMTWQDFAHDVLVTMTSTPLAAGAQAGVARAVRGREQDDAGRREEIIRKFNEGLAQFEKVTEQAARAASAERAARGPATHTIEGMPVRPRVEGGQPVQGVWETDEGDLVEAPRAEPLKAPEPNAEWTVNGVQYEVEIIGPGREEGTARLADGQEVPLTEFRSLGDEAKALLGIEEDLAGVKPVTRRRPARGEEPPPPPGSRRPDVWPPPGFTLNPEEARRPEFTEGENKWDAIRRKKEESREAWMRRLRQRAADRKAIDVDRDTITDAIIKLGGINVSERLDLSGDDKSNRQIPFVGYLFTRQGDSVDGMAEKLYELGYIEDRSDVRALAERIRDELGGLAQHWSMNRSEAAIGAQLQAEAEAQQLPEDQELATEADELARAPLHYDISPEDLAERELEPNAANIVIADLLSQLDEDTRERLSMQYADADDETFIEALRNELARGEYGTQTTPGTTRGRQARQLPPQYEVKREGAAEGETAAQPIAAVRPVRTAEGRLKAFGPKPAARLVTRAEDVEWDEYMDYYNADINGRLVSIWKPSEEDKGHGWYQVIVSGSMTQLTNNGRAQTLAEAQRLAFAEHELLPEVRMDSKGRVIGEKGGRGERTRVEQPVQIYDVNETLNEWVGRMKAIHGDKWIERGERVIAEMKRSLRERPMRSESEVGYTDDVLSFELTRNLISAMEMAITKAKISTAKQPEAPEYSAQAVLNEVDEEIAAGKGNATTLENDQVNAFTGLLARSGWTPIKRGKGVDWTKGSAVLFLRSQGPEAQTIVQWSIQEGGARAEKVRGDEGQVQGERDVGEKSERQGRADLQRAEKARPKAGDRKTSVDLAGEKPTKAPQPKLTGPEPPLLTTPEGVAPPKDVEEQKVPTQQLKLFQRTVDYAAQQTRAPESEAQAEAGNYQKGHWIVGPKGSQLDISIETPEGERRNPDWPPLKDHYGYIRGTIGFDKDHLDVFVKPGTRDDFAGNLYVVNQVVGSFDEHKVMLGYATVEEAREAYLRNYEQGWDGLDSIIPMTFKGFAEWAQTKGARGPQGGPLTLTAARRFDEVSKPAEGTDRDQGAATPQLDLFAQTTVPGEKAGEPAGVLFERIVVESEQVGKIRLPVGKIQTHADAASAFAQLAKAPREQFHMIALNEQNEPIAYYPLFQGSVTQTSVYPREVWLALYQTPGAKKVWIAHNHPSGIAAPSRADELLTETLRAGLDRDLGVEYMGHIIIAGNRALVLESGNAFDIPSPQAGNDVAIRERVIRVEERGREPLTSPGMVRDYLRQLQTDKSGLLLMDAQHRVIAYYYMTPQEMSRLRTGDLGTGFARLMRQVGRNNPAAAIAYFPGREYSPEIQRAVSNVGGALEGADVRMLDAFTFGPVAPAQGVAERMDAEAERPLLSFAERGHTLTLKPFYSLSGRWSDMTVMRMQEELMSDPLARAMRGYIEYVDNPYQLPQDAIDDLLDMGGIAKVAGVWSPTRKKVFLVASNMQPGEARTILLHELVGHYGMDQIFGEQYVDFMLDVYRSRAGDIQAQARPGGPLHNYQFDFRKIEHQLHSAAEFIAHAAERGEEPNLWQRFVAMVRLWLREKGFVKEWSDTDILMLLKISKNALINGGDATYNGKPAFNLKAATPIWRSTLMDRVRELAPAKADAKQWRAFVTGLMQKGVKPDEIEWSGLREWLDAMGPMETASKEALLSFLTEHGVQINERMLGELYGGTRNPDADRLLQERDNLSVALDAVGYSVIWDPNGNFRGVENRDTNILYLPPGVKPTDVPGAERAIYDAVKQFDALRQRRVTVQLGGVSGPIHTAVERLAEIAPTTREFGDIEQTAANVTRYENWTLPGGRNYREILLTLPVRKGEYDVVIPPHARQDVYNPPHFDTLNLLAHVRFNERTDADGKRVLFVEEWQSDWGEQGRKGRGFETERERQKAFLNWAMDRGFAHGDADMLERWLTVNFRGNYYQQFLHETKRQALVPKAPFVQKTEQWAALLVKRIIRYAVENGFDRIAWTTGQQQIDRYGLQTPSKDVTLIRRGQTAEREWSLSGTHVRGAAWGAIDISDAQMVDRLGKDIAARVHAANLQPGGSITITAKQLGVDVFYVGPKGMLKFYDEIMPVVVNNVLKKVGGGKVREIGFHSFGEEFAGAKNVDPSQRPGLQPGFDITPAMRDAALRGLPMFALRDDVTRMADQIRVLSRRVDQAYRRGASNAEDLDAELAALRGRYYHAIEQLEGELETEAEAEDAEDFTTPEEQFRNAYWQFMAGQITKADYLERMRDVADKPGSDEQLIAAGRDALAAWMARAQRRARFSLREPTGVREVYGVREGRLLGMAVRRGLTSGLWDVYLASGANESMFTRGQFRREQAASLNEVNQMFNREGLELNVIKPRNIPLPDKSLFDRDWVAPRVDSLLRKTIINFQNRLLLPELYERTISREVGAIPPEARAHREARIAHPRAAGKIADFEHEFTEPLVDLMRANGFTLKDVGMYLYARHAPERNAAIEAINPENRAGSGMTDERAAAVMEGLRERLGARFAAMEQIGVIANNISRFRENVLIDKGLAKLEAVALMQQKYPNYVPLKEMAEDEDIQSTNNETKGGYQVGRLLMTAFGRFTEAQSEFILPALVAQAKGTISAGENAEVLRSLLRLVEFAPNPDVWRIQKHVWKPYIDKDTGQVQYAPRPIQIDANYSSRAISVPVNGERVIILLADPRLAQAYKQSGLPLDKFSQSIGVLTRFYALMATAANPEFVLTNLIRDFQQAMIRITGEQNTGLAAKVAKDVPGALWGAFAGLRAKGQLTGKAGIWHRWYRRYIEAGGHIAYRGLQDVETQHKDFMLTLAENGIMPEAVSGLEGARLRAHRGAKVVGAKYVAHLIMDANGAVENALRLSAFKNAVEAGWSEKDAAMLARNVTVDFNLKGEWSTRFGAYFMFLNANVQGTALLFRSVMNHRSIQALALLLFLSGMGFDWWNDKTSATEPDGRKVYDNINDAIKERNFILMTPDGQAAVTVPLPFGFNVFYVAGVHAMSAMRGAKTPLDAARATFVTMINAFNPLGQSPETKIGAIQLLTPTFLDPTVQAITNRNWFDRSIVPERSKNAPPQAAAATYYAGTPAAYVDVSTWLNEATGGNEVRSGVLDISPNMLEHWTRSIFGSAGAFVARVGEFGHAKMVDEELEIRNVPFLRRFYYEPKDFELSHRFYENLNAAEVAHYEVQRAYERGQPDKARAYAGEFSGERAMYLEAQAIERLVGQLRSEVWKVRKNERLSDDQRKKQVDQLQERIRQSMMTFNKRFEERAEP